MKNVRLTKLGGKSALLITSLLLTPFYGYSEKSNVIPEKNEKAGVQQQTSLLTGIVLDKDGFPLIGVYYGKCYKRNCYRCRW